MAISRSKVKIYVVDIATTNALLADSDVIEGEITSYAETGGDTDVESVPAFGGFIDKEKTPEQVEVSLEIVPSLGTNALIWAAMRYTEDTANAGVYTMATEGGTTPSKKKLVFQAYDGTNYQSIAYNNCTVTELNMDHSADDNRTISMTFKASPTNESGVSNYMESAVAATALPEFTELDNN